MPPSSLCPQSPRPGRNLSGAPEGTSGAGAAQKVVKTLRAKREAET